MISGERTFICKRSTRKTAQRASAMIEIFKTNVRDPFQAKMIVALIHDVFSHYKANFDLHDADNILRIHSFTDHIEVTTLVDLLKRYDVVAEIFLDEVPAIGKGFH